MSIAALRPLPACRIQEVGAFATLAVFLAATACSRPASTPPVVAAAKESSASGATEPAAAKAGRTSATSRSSSPPSIASASACALLTVAEVHRAFPGSRPGEGDRSEDGGRQSCEWRYPGGRLLLTLAAAPSRPVNDEAKALARALLDPFRRDAGSNVRYEAMRTVGSEAVALVEQADLTRGIVDDGAWLIVRQGSNQAVVVATNLASRDRGEALRLLEQIGAALAARMN